VLYNPYGEVRFGPGTAERISLNLAPQMVAPIQHADMD